MKQICENCKWWKRLNPLAEGMVEKNGRCHYYPPKVNTVIAIDNEILNEDVQPRAREDNFCSRFQEVEKEPEY
jgi:hypothetical protein